MQFRVIGPLVSYSGLRNCIVLVRSSWNDWFKYTTLYNIDYVNQLGETVHIGSTKIGRVGMEGASFDDTGNLHNRRPNPPENFDQLPENYFSLGQDSSFYKNLEFLGENMRADVLEALNDIAYSEGVFDRVIEEDVTKVSLLRDVSIATVTSQYRRLALGTQGRINYSFSYTSRTRSRSNPFSMSFEVNPRSAPPSNVQVIIGRNGVGKTTLINDMISSLLNSNSEENNLKYGHFEIATSERNDNRGFANLVSVSFSAFDDTEPPRKKRDMTNEQIRYSYIGLKRAPKIGETKSETKTSYMLQTEFFKSIRACVKLGKLDLWRRSIQMLESDQIFSYSNVIELSLMNPDNLDFEKKSRRLFEKFSSGHRVVLLTITKLVEKIEEKSLVLLDEPEAHLHPPLLAAFVRALSDLMTLRNGVALVATHSPVVLQEVPKSCVWTLSRSGANSTAERLDQETFGENVGVLTKNVFGLEVTNSGFHKLISKSVRESDSFEEVLEDFGGEIGNEGQAIVQTLMYLKNQENEES